MSFDHGVLNIPNRTRNIDRDLDRYKREQEAAKRASHKAHVAKRAELKATAKALLAECEESILARHGEKFGASKLRKLLRNKAHYEPSWLIQFIEKFKAE